MVDRRDDDILFLALLALLANANVDEPYAYELLRRLRRTGRFREALGPEIDELFDRVVFRSRPRLVDEIREALSFSFSRLAGTLEHGSEQSNYAARAVERLQQQLDEMKAQLDRLRQFTDYAAADLYDLTWLLSVGADVASARITRHVPARIYFAESVSSDDRSAVVSALDDLMREAGLDLTEQLPDEEGSWWKRLIFRTKTALNQDEVQMRLRKAERAVEAHYLAKPEAEANNLQASGAAALIAALAATENAAIQVGSLLIIKVTDTAGKCIVLARTLTPDELKRLEENQSILRQPERVLELLQTSDERNA